MDKLLRGYVTPEDFTGNDSQKLQAALDYAAQQDIRKVVVTGALTLTAPVTVPAQTYLVLKDACIRAEGTALRAEKHCNYSFCQNWIHIQGENAVIYGDLSFFNTAHLTMTGLELHGFVTMEYTAWVRTQALRFIGEAGIRVGRGCCNSILQGITGETVCSPIVLDAGISCGDIVPGSMPQLQSIVIQDCCLTSAQPGIVLAAAEDAGLANVQIDHIHASGTAVVIGRPGQSLPPEQYFNLTVTHIDAPEKLAVYNETKHAYLHP